MYVHSESHAAYTKGVPYSDLALPRLDQESTMTCLRRFRVLRPKLLLSCVAESGLAISTGEIYLPHKTILNLRMELVRKQEVFGVIRYRQLANTRFTAEVCNCLDRIERYGGVYALSLEFYQ